MEAPPTAGLNGMDQLVCDGGERNVGGEGEDRHRAEPLAQAPLCSLTHTALTSMEKIKYNPFLEAISGYALEWTAESGSVRIEVKNSEALQAQNKAVDVHS